MPVSQLARDFITAHHPVYNARRQQWEMNEKVYRGGVYLRQLLERFGHEAKDPEHYEARQRMATAINFNQRMAERFVGHLAAEAPDPFEGGIDFGTLGSVRPFDQIQGPLTQAEILYYNCDRRRSGWIPWWNNTQKWSMVTGHVWTGVELPVWRQERRPTQEDEQRGHRPYLVQYSPLYVPNWHYEEGRLCALALTIRDRVLVRDGSVQTSYTDRTLLYVAEGFDALGDQHADGGWWLIDDDRETVIREGTLETFGGEIPYTPLFFAYDHDDLSMSAMDEATAATITYLNLASAGTNDALEGGARYQYVLGVKVANFNKAAEVKEQGGRLIPVEPTPVGDSHIVPSVWDSASVSASSAIEATLKRTREDADAITSDMLSYGPQTSGEARMIEFRDVKAPRLSMMAQYREDAATFCINRAEEGFGSTAPTGREHWPKRFDVEDTTEDWQELFEAAMKGDAQSPTLVMIGLRQIAEQKGIRVQDAEWAKIEQEIQDAHNFRQQAADDIFGGPDNDGRE